MEELEEMCRLDQSKVDKHWMTRHNHGQSL